MEVGLGQNQTREIKVGVVLDLQTKFSKICLTAINMSLSDFYKDNSNYSTRLVFHVRDSMEDVVQASAAAALDLIKNEQVSAIIGPRNSMQAEFMIRLADKTQVPTITFSATSPLLTSIKSPYFVRATIDDSSQVTAIAAIVKSFGWRSVVAIYVDNELGKGIMPYLSDALQNVEVIRSVIPPEANDDQIQKELRKLMTMQTRVFVVHMESSLALRIFQKAREIGMMEEGYVWLITNGMTHMMRHIDRGRSLNTLEGVLGVRSHVPKSKELEDFRLRWKRRFDKENPSMRDDAELNVFALWAYDSITALAKGMEKANTKSLWDDNPLTSANRRTYLGTLGVSRYGPILLEALSDIRFMGLAGEFNLIDAQLESSTFEIINYVGNEEKIIGFWTPSNAILNKTTLGQVIWPGKSKVVPKGWEILGNKLRVGVPVKRGFLNFVDIKYNTIGNSVTPTGYSIDVFQAALRKLPYPVIPQYFPFNPPDQSYDTIVHQVYNGTYDAVVGDITIIANRSLYVDFTLPYSESGVFMLVPMRDSNNKNTWVFLQPWSFDLWVTTACFFVYIGFIVWILEHRVNTDFRGPPHHQIGTSFWFSFSTMNFAHREKVVSNLARFVVIVWCFVVLVLTQSYTANLTSFLTAQRFHPDVTTMKDLIKNGESVGYQLGSFVRELLKSQGFNESQLKSYNNSEHCHELLSSGTSKGGIAAAFDEVAYLKVILFQSCNKYALVEPSFKTAGFGFVFPKNSPLTGDVSRAILNVTQGDEMKPIENKWFGNQSNCPDPDTTLSSHGLTLSSFWGLFLIAGLASFLALLVFVANFLYEHRHTLFGDSEISFSKKLTFLLRNFDEKDRKSHMFKESAVHNWSSPITQCTPRPSTVQMTPWPRSPAQNMQFESRCVSFVQSEEFFTPQLEQDEDEGTDTECGAQ
uniref:Glutamate receptor n=1 Tax=Boechera divaricarpa TaxID=115915 RepID=B6REL3_9BRAS|nr:glutamate receptor 1 [Boechera divaricarpa]